MGVLALIFGLTLAATGLEVTLGDEFLRTANTFFNLATLVYLAFLQRRARPKVESIEDQVHILVEALSRSRIGGRRQADPPGDVRDDL